MASTDLPGACAPAPAAGSRLVRGRAWTRSPWLIAGAALALHLIFTLTISHLSRFPNSFDELEHLSYVRVMARAPALLPHFPVGPILTPDARGWSAAPNYLNHPSPYYLAMGALDRLAGGDIGVLRGANVVLSTLGLALTLAGGFLMLGGARERTLFALALVAFPKTPVVGGIVSNDNAALLATGLAVLGLGLWSRRRDSTAAMALLAVALALAGWTKLTAFVSFAAVLAMLAVLAQRTAGRAGERRWPRAAWVPALPLAGFALGCLPTLANLLTYGRPLWHPPTFYVPLWRRVPMGMGEYAALFAHKLAKGWSVLEPASPAAQFGLVAILVVVLALATRGLGRRATDAERVASAFVLALAPVLAMHFLFGWQALQEDGYREAAQVRYYYVLWPGFALALAALPRALPAGAARTAGALLALALLAPGSPLMTMVTLARQGWPVLV